MTLIMRLLRRAFCLQRAGSIAHLEAFIVRPGHKLLLLTQHQVDVHPIIEQIRGLGLCSRSLLLDVDSIPEVTSQVQVKAFPALLYLRHMVVLDLATGSQPRDILYRYFGVSKGPHYFEGLLQRDVALFLKEMEAAGAETQQPFATELEVLRSRDLSKALRLYSRHSTKRHLYQPILCHLEAELLQTLPSDESPQARFESLLQHHLYKAALDLALEAGWDQQAIRRCVVGLAQQTPRHDQLIARVSRGQH